MYISWKEQLSLRPELNQFKNWPYIDIQTINKRKRGQFLRNKQIVQAVLDGIPYDIISKKYTISQAQISHLIRRALSGTDEEGPALTKALIPYYRIEKSNRTSQLSTLQAPTGAACAFQSLLANVKGLKEGLDRVIKAKLEDKRYAQNLKPSWFYGQFRQLLRQANWPLDTYPYTEEREAYESVRVYLHRRTDELRIRRLEKSMRHYFTHSPANRLHPLSEVQLDEQTYDVQQSVTLVIDNCASTLRVARTSLLITTDVDTKCILSYSLELTGHPAQSDVERCLKSIHRPWQPRTLVTPGLAYPPIAGFPSSSIDGFSSMGIGEIQMDNALAHHANRTRAYVSRTLFATLNLGKPRSPKDRNWVELAIKTASDLGHQFASTTGSHVRDPKKESHKNRKRPPLLTLKILEDCLDVVISTYNGVVQAQLGGYSPLDLLKEKTSTRWFRCLPIHLTQSILSNINSKRVTVRWLKHEHRAPHVVFYSVRYQGNGLNNVTCINQEIKVTYPENDIRVLKAYTLSGEYIGELYAPKSWQSHPHSVKTRQYVMKFTKKERIGTADILSAYFGYLLKEKNNPSSAREIVRIFREFSSVSPPSVNLSDSRHELQPTPQSDREPAAFPDWTPELSRIPTDERNR